MKDAIKWLVLVIVLAVSSGGLYYQYQNTRPCAHPILYAIGAVDVRFGITNSAVVNQAKAAAAIWNTAAGKPVLVYDPKASLKIHLIYDEREASAKLGIQIAREQASIDSARAALDASRTRLVAAQDTYNQTVNDINARGGATGSEVAALAALRDTLKNLENTINSRVVSFNASIAVLNAVVTEYNQTAGHTFEEGNYTRDSAGERISIFEFVGTAQLERVLAHEFGHAISLDHNSDPKSIMFAKNESGNLIPTAADLTALRAVCGA